MPVIPHQHLPARTAEGPRSPPPVATVQPRVQPLSMSSYWADASSCTTLRKEKNKVRGLHRLYTSFNEKKERSHIRRDFFDCQNRLYRDARSFFKRDVSVAPITLPHIAADAPFSIIIK